jgi:hypothetical protein
LEPATISIDRDTVTVADLVVTDEAVAQYLGTVPPEIRGSELVRAISIGVHGLAATTMRATVDEMKDQVRRLISSAAEAAEIHLGAAVEAGRTELSAHLDPEVRSSLTARTVAELEELHRATLARLDPDRTDSHTGKLVGAITDLLGPTGLLAQRLEEAFDSAEADHGLGRLLDTFEKRFQEMRDLVVGGQQRQQEAERGTAKGFEFEDELEAVLRHEARAMSGCVVERTGYVGGTLGSQAKVGDFAVVLPDGTRVAVEAKNTTRIGLAGTTGILSELDQAMDNRNATWAVCVSRGDAFPAEVGSFGIYGNRILVVDSGDGTLTRVALRWIAAAARAAAGATGTVDAGAALEKLDRIRGLAQHFSRSKNVLTSAQSGLDSVREELDSLRSNLLDLVDDLARALHPSVEVDRQVA